MDEDGFYLKVARALSGCQLVEQQLKRYITEALELVKKCVGDKMPNAHATPECEAANMHSPIGHNTAGRGIAGAIHDEIYPADAACKQQELRNLYPIVNQSAQGLAH